MTEEFESEVQTMCNLSRALVERGIEQGIERGIEQRNRTLAEMMLKDHESLEKIRRYTGYEEEELKEIAGKSR